jgi:hypothetical protein
MKFTDRLLGGKSAEDSDGVDAPSDGIDVPRWRGLATEEEAPMSKVSTIGLDLAKNVFQVHGADVAGAVVFRKRLRRASVLQFFALQPPVYGCDGGLCGIALLGP